MSRPKVLIIEESGEARAQLERALRDEFDLLIARDPATAVPLAREQNPTLILLDLGLPPNPADPEEGLRLLREIRKTGVNAKVMVYSSYGQRQHAVRAISYGAYDFFTKPLDLDLLKLLVHR
ncbi:MAG: response regulator, partial [Nitrospirales bacterium]